MIIENVAASLPERKVGNEEVVDLIRFNSKSFSGDLSRTLRAVQFHLDRSGLIHRSWLSEGELPFNHVDRAVHDALKGTPLRPNDIELFIYVGIGGSFHKLGNAYILANKLGMHKAECFDILDACMSWTRAVSLVNSLFKTRRLRNAMVVNAEFNMVAGGPLFPANYSLQGPGQLNASFPSYTIGEAATATLLLPERPENFRISFHAKPELADLCTIPSPGFEGFCQLTDAAGKLGVGRFAALGAKLHQHLEQEMPYLLANAGGVAEEADIVLTHTSSSTDWHKLGEKNGFAEKIFHVYPHTGNVVSASIPTALAEARQEGRITVGQRVMFLMGSAGMSFAMGTFLN